MPRRHQPVDEYGPGNEDYEYDAWRQLQVDEEGHAETILREQQQIEENLQ